MSLAHWGAGVVIAMLALAGGPADAATAPERPQASVRQTSTSNGIHVQFIRSYSSFAPYQSCTWEALASGGDPLSHTYTWTPGGSWSTPDGALVEDWSFGNYWAGHATTTGWYELTVTVTDAYGNYGSATASGTVELYLNPDCD